MADEPTEPQSGLWEELKRRKVVRVAIAYAVAGWMVVEVALSIFPEFGIPAWANRMVILLVALGFPIAVVLSWAFELTPAGLQRTRAARESHGPVQDSAPQQRKRNRLAVMVGALIPGVIFGALLGAAGLWVALDGRSTGGALSTSEAPEPADAVTQPTVVAVLPLVNMSPKEENAFFADGVHEEILTELSRLGQIKVISRTSVMGYAGREHNIREIAQELHATHVVEGSVRRAGDRVRITAQLIDAATDQHLWAENFDRDLEDIFEVQSDVAAQIAAALDAELEGHTPRAFGTRNIEAYDRYLQARSLSVDPFSTRDGDYARMLELLDDALAVDPKFVQAWELESEVAGRWSFQSLQAPDGVAGKARDAAARVTELAPGSVEAFMARAWVSYYVDLAFDRALGEVHRARALAPNLLQPMELEAYLLRRLGRFDECIALMRELLGIDPRNPQIWQQLSLSLAEAGRNEEAYQSALQVAELQPASARLDAVMELWRLAAYPDFAAMQALADRVVALARAGQTSQDFFTMINFLQQVGRDGDAKAVSDAMSAAFLPTGLSDLPNLPIALYHQSRALEFRGQHDEALDAAEQALTVAEQFEERIGTGPGQLRTMNDITVGYLGPFTGRPELAEPALERIRRAYEEDPDALQRRDHNYFLMEVLTGSDPEQARDLLLETYGTPACRLTPTEMIMSIHLWYPLLEDPRVRKTLFADKPMHVKYLRELWPAARPFPFDA